MWNITASFLPPATICLDWLRLSTVFTVFIKGSARLSGRYMKADSSYGWGRGEGGGGQTTEIEPTNIVNMLADLINLVIMLADLSDFICEE